MNRFFFSPDQLNDGFIILTGEDARHLSRVLRASVGDRVELCDDGGCCRSAVIVALDRSRVICRPEEDRLPSGEASVYVTLAFGLPKGDKADLTVQKVTELGVASLIPFYSGRTVPRPAAHKEMGRQERWQRIARSAAAQSRRSRVPPVAPVCSWRELLALFAGYHRVILFYEGERKNTLKAALAGLSAGEKVLLVTGPEGGFTAAETREALDKGAAAVTLGPRVLRAETAAVTAVALTLYEAGEMGGGR